MRGIKTFGLAMAAVGLLAGCGPESELESAEVLGEAQQAVTSCQYRLSVTGVRAIDGQGALEGKMEVRLTATQGASSIVLPGSSTYYTLDPGANAPWHTLNNQISILSVTGSKTVTVDVDVLELDSGTLGADDHGSKAVTMTLTCGGSPVVLTPDISLYRDKMGSYEGVVEVRLRGEQI